MIQLAFGREISFTSMLCYIPIFGPRLSEATDIFAGRYSLFELDHLLLSSNDLELKHV